LSNIKGAALCAGLILGARLTALLMTPPSPHVQTLAALPFQVSDAAVQSSTRRSDEECVVCVGASPPLFLRCARCFERAAVLAFASRFERADVPSSRCA